MADFDSRMLFHPKSFRLLRVGFRWSSMCMVDSHLPKTFVEVINSHNSNRLLGSKNCYVD